MGVGREGIRDVKNVKVGVGREGIRDVKNVKVGGRTRREEGR